MARTEILCFDSIPYFFDPQSPCNAPLVRYCRGVITTNTQLAPAMAGDNTINLNVSDRLPIVDTSAIRTLSGDCPVYMHYSGQTEAQSAYLELIPHEGGIADLSAYYNPEIGDSIPMSVYHGTVLRWRIPNDLTCAGINALVSDILPMLRQIAGGYSDRWDGSNWIGSLTNDAQAASDELERIVWELEPEEYERHEIWDAAD